jgi:hypothetical protein
MSGPLAPIGSIARRGDAVVAVLRGLPVTAVSSGQRLARLYGRHGPGAWLR